VTPAAAVAPAASRNLRRLAVFESDFCMSSPPRVNSAGLAIAALVYSLTKATACYSVRLNR
jgi:hypothetical protein